jgi:hypothetical protein
MGQEDVAGANLRLALGASAILSINDLIFQFKQGASSPWLFILQLEQLFNCNP